jgi:hypothetical protein
MTERTAPSAAPAVKNWVPKRALDEDNTHALISVFMLARVYALLSAPDKRRCTLLTVRAFFSLSFSAFAHEAQQSPEVSHP